MQTRTALILIGCLQTAMHASQSVYLGGGLNMSNSSEESDVSGIETKFRPGFNVGVGMDYFFNETFGVSPGISLETRGQKIEGSADIFGTTYSVEGTAKFLYLQVPVLAKAQFKAGPATIQAIAGPEFGFPLSKKLESKVTVDGESETDESDAELKAFDLGLSFGAGLRFPAGAIGLFLEPSYFLGLTNSSDAKDDPDTEEDEAGDVMHRNFKLKVGIYKDL